MSQMMGFLALLLVIMLGACQPASKISTEDQLRAKANDWARKYIIIDTHLDTPYQLSVKTEDITRSTENTHFDYPRAIEGGLNAAFMAVYVPAEGDLEGGARARADALIDLVEGWAATWPDKFVMVRSAGEVERQFAPGRISLALGIENGTALEGELDNLKHFYDRGVRYITLTHSRNNDICDSSFDEEAQGQGLSPFGREVVAEMNRLGMMVDVTHVSDKAFYQVMELSRAPVIASHSACRHFTPGWERNMDDEMIKLLAKKGGVIQINFGAGFVNEKANQEMIIGWERMREYRKTHNLKRTDQAAQDYKNKYWREHPLRAEAADVAAHIDHVVKLVGIEHVGLGSDFDGLENLPEGLKDVADYPNLIYELLKQGYGEEDIRKICSANFLRVWSAVERIASEL